MATNNRANRGISDEYKDFAHTGPGTLAGRYLRTFWQPVHVAADLPSGRAVPIRVMSEDFTLYRGETGKPHLLDFRCAHRQTQLSTGWVEEDNIRCFYHGWMYDGSGQCVQQPGEFKPFSNRIKIPSYPVEEYLGVIWAYLGEGQAPPLPRYPELEGNGTRVSTYVRQCNYFQVLENEPDHVHVFFVHHARAGSGRADSPIPDYDLDAYTQWRKQGGSKGFDGFMPRITAQETEWGILFTNSYELGSYQQGIAMPNIGRRGRVWAWRVPIDDESYRSFSITQARPDRAGQGNAGGARRGAEDSGSADDSLTNEATEAILRGEASVDDFFYRADITLVADSVAQIGQGRITDRSKENLGATDAGIAMLRRIWSREMRLLAEGKPLKQWTIPPSISGIEGVTKALIRV